MSAGAIAWLPGVADGDWPASPDEEPSRESEPSSESAVGASSRASSSARWAIASPDRERASTAACEEAVVARAATDLAS